MARTKKKSSPALDDPPLDLDQEDDKEVRQQPVMRHHERSLTVMCVHNLMYSLRKLARLWAMHRKRADTTCEPRRVVITRELKLVWLSKPNKKSLQEQRRSEIRNKPRCRRRLRTRFDTLKVSNASPQCRIAMCWKIGSPQPDLRTGQSRQLKVSSKRRLGIVAVAYGFGHSKSGTVETLAP